MTLPLAAFALGDLVLVVGEEEIEPAAVKVEGLSQELAAHGRALDVPAGATLAPRAVPRGLAGLGGLPQRKVERLALLLSDLDALAGLHVVELSLREPRIRGVLADLKVDVSLGLVGDALGDERLDERDDLGNRVGDLGRDIGLEQVQRLGVGLEFADEAGGERDGLLAGLLRGVDDLVVDVRVIAHVPDLQTLVPKVPDDHFERGEGAGVADVHKAVDRGAADVDPDLAGHQRRQGLLLTRHRVEDSDPRSAHGRGTLWEPGVRSVEDLRRPAPFGHCFAAVSS